VKVFHSGEYWGEGGYKSKTRLNFVKGMTSLRERGLKRKITGSVTLEKEGGGINWGKKASPFGHVQQV